MGLPAGKLHDARYFKAAMISGSLLYIFSCAVFWLLIFVHCCRHYELRFFMLSLAKPQHYYQVFLPQAVGMGIGMGLVIVPAISLPSQYFRRRRSLVMGLVYAGES